MGDRFRHGYSIEGYRSPSELPPIATVYAGALHGTDNLGRVSIAVSRPKYPLRASWISSTVHGQQGIDVYP